MLLPDDLSHYMVGQADRGFIAPDTWGYFSWLARDGADFLSRLPMGASDEDGLTTWRRLRSEGLACEERFLRWRTRAGREKLVCALDVHEEISERIGALVESSAVILLTRGHTRYDARARQFLDQRYAYDHRLTVIARAVRRSYADLDGFDRAAIEEGLAISNANFETTREALGEEAGTIREYLPTNFNLDMRNARAHIARGKKRKRRAIIRAINFASRLIGEEKTRLFVGGDRLRVEGRHAVYELTSRRQMAIGHGGATLKVFTKDDDIELCKLCIYTPGVPLMDHVANIVMHIKADSEEDILRIGNAYDIQPAARDQPWLLPFLPALPLVNQDEDSLRAMYTGQRFILGNVYTQRFLQAVPKFPSYRAIPTQVPVPEDQQDRLLDISRQIFAQIEDALGPLLPQMEFHRHLLTTGFTPPAPPLPAHALNNPVALIEQRDDEAA